MAYGIKYDEYPNGFVASREAGGAKATGIGRTKKEAYKNMKLAEKRLETDLRRRGIMSELVVR
jgi:hypothetical protein